jgi:hypothetical protein
MNALALIAPATAITTLDDLVARFESDETANNPDALIDLDKVRATAEGTIRLPHVRGEFALNDWSRSQLATTLGIRWDRWFENAPANDRAEELNRRLARASGTIRVRTTKLAPDGVEANGTIRAFVGADYSPIPDALVAGILREALRGVEDDVRIVRHSTTDLTTNFVVRLGDRLTPSAEVGAVEGCVYVRNSGVGYARLVVGLLLHRLACKNGLIVQVPGATLVRAVHRHIDPARIRARLTDGLRDLPAKLNRSARALAEATHADISNPELEIRDVLREARLPLRLVVPVMAAYAREPRPTRFGVSQALTLAAQGESPEFRHDLERAAGLYLAQA